MTKSKLRVIVLMGGQTPEHQVSLSTGKQVIKNLDKSKYQTTPFLIPKQGSSWVNKLVNLAKDKQPTVVFIALHGPYGEDGTIQGLLELLGLAYTGAGVLASAMGMDKAVFHQLMKKEAIPMADYLIIEKSDPQTKILRRFKFPLVVKPINQGSSIGITIIKKRTALNKALKLAFKYSSRVMVEEYLKGTEISCGLLGNQEPIALPVIEICPKNDFFDYEAKYIPGMSQEIVPARIPKGITRKVQEIALQVYKSIGCRGFGRVDMIIVEGKPYVLEINTIPGLTPTSLLPQEAAVANISYPQLLDRLIELALEE